MEAWGRAIAVGGLRRRAEGGKSVAACDVSGEELYFSSANLEVAALSEVFASALLPPAAQHGDKLVFDSPLDPVWLDGAAAILRTWAGWWSTPARLDDCLEAPRRERTEAGERRTGGTALCFSGGVDSFHTLLASGRRFDWLLLCEGYDIPLGDTARMADAERSLRAVAQATGARAAVFRTNLRQLPSVRGSGWGRTHGGALAALGHACGDRVAELVISSTHHVTEPYPWGSHWDTDAGWSSSRLRVMHHGHGVKRIEKVTALAREPLARRYLRVCWENRSASGNCGECEKCCRTMLHLHLAGADPAEWPFAGSGSLAERIAAVESVHPNQVSNYTDALPHLHGEPALRRAVEGLIARQVDPWKVREERLRMRAQRRQMAR